MIVVRLRPLADAAHRREDNCAETSGSSRGIVRPYRNAGTRYNEHKVSSLVGKKESRYDTN